MSRERVVTSVFIVAVIVAMLYPLVWNPHNEDSFPLSNYPMFSRPMPDAMMHRRYVLGIEADGTRHHIGPRFIGTVRLLQSAAVIDAAIRGGGKMQRALCERVAARIATDMPEVVTVQLVSGSHDAVQYFSDRVPGPKSKERIHRTCLVERAP